MSSLLSQSSISRRELLQKAKHFAPVLPWLAFAGSAMAQSSSPKPTPPANSLASPPECKPIADNDPVAKALKYVPDVSKIPAPPAKMGVEGKNQNCANCQLFAKPADSKADLGKCTMFANGCVASKGWCTAWIKKA